MRTSGTFRIKSFNVVECKNCMETCHEYYENEAPEDSECPGAGDGKHDWTSYDEIPRPER